MQNILAKLPKSVLNVLNILKNNGYEAYIVGGAVRDTLLSRKVEDYDICTNALPIEIRKVFLEQKYKVIETGIKHGTVSVVNNNVAYEITTFRQDGEYKDSRHPEQVKFNVSLEEDLKRRDFTINALACDALGNIIDYNNGISDLKNKIIRTVGNPNERFDEDALRILRALRFKTVLDFNIEENTKKAMFFKAKLIKNVSIERINQETKKILDCSYEAIREYEKILRIAYDYNVQLNKKDYNVLKRLPDHTMKMAYLYSYYDNEVLINRLNNLKLKNETKNLILEFISNSKEYKDNYFDNYQIKKYLSKYGTEEAFIQIQYLCYLHNIDILYMKEKIDNLLTEVVTLKNLNINGEDLISLGYNGKEIGIILDQLLELVLRDKVKNDNKSLIKAIKRIKI